MNSMNQYIHSFYLNVESIYFQIIILVCSLADSAGFHLGACLTKVILLTSLKSKLIPITIINY